MRRVAQFIVVAGAIVIVAPGVGSAHFKLMEPASWIVENERGDPQKAGPCGGSNTDWGKPTFAVAKVTGGQKIHLKLQETIYHPGHYRVALAVNSPLELPADPVAMTRATDKGPWSESAEIQNPVKMPVLADGLFIHSTRPETCPPTGICVVPGFWESDIQLPNITCQKCTLQIVQFMEDHGYNNPGGYTYHHCANLQITADKSKPIDSGWPAERPSTH